MQSAKDLLDRTVAAWNANDRAGVLAMGSPSIELNAPGGLDFRGLDGLGKWYDLWAEACPDRRVRYTNVVGEGDRLVGEGVFTGTQTGVLHLPSGDVPPTGRHVTATFAAAFRFADGKITSMRHYFDQVELMVQLGLMGVEAKA
jgi:predicted ester cyclase